MPRLQPTFDSEVVGSGGGGANNANNANNANGELIDWGRKWHDQLQTGNPGITGKVKCKSVRNRFSGTFEKCQEKRQSIFLSVPEVFQKCAKSCPKVSQGDPGVTQK